MFGVEICGCRIAYPAASVVMSSVYMIAVWGFLASVRTAVASRKAGEGQVTLLFGSFLFRFGGGGERAVGFRGPLDCFCLQLAVGWSELPTSDSGADLLAVSEIGFVCDSKLGRGFADPLALPALDVDTSARGVDGKGSEEAVAIRAGVFNIAELGVDLWRIALMPVGPADPFIRGRVNVQIRNPARAVHMVNMSVPVDCQQDLVSG